MEPELEAGSSALKVIAPCPFQGRQCFPEVALPGTVWMFPIF